MYELFFPNEGNRSQSHNEISEPAITNIDIVYQAESRDQRSKFVLEGSLEASEIRATIS